MPEKSASACSSFSSASSRLCETTFNISACPPPNKNVNSSLNFCLIWVRLELNFSLDTASNCFITPRSASIELSRSFFCLSKNSSLPNASSYSFAAFILISPSSFIFKLSSSTLFLMPSLLMPAILSMKSLSSRSGSIGRPFKSLLESSSASFSPLISI